MTGYIIILKHGFKKYQTSMHKIYLPGIIMHLPDIISHQVKQKWDKNVWEIHKTHRNECYDLNVECYYIVDTQFLYPDTSYIIWYII